MNKTLLLLLFSLSLHSEFSTLEGTKVPTDTSLPVQNVHYLIPNESTPALFGIDKLKEPTGLSVSVGTIRSLVIFAWAEKITHLWMLDIDSEVVNFNKRHLNFIACIAQKYPGNFLAQRIEYFANFHGLELSQAEVESEAQSPFVDLRRLRQVLLFRNKSTPQNSCWANAQLPEAQEFIAINRHKNSEILFGYSALNNDGGRYYWEDDGQWKKIVDAIFEKRIAVSSLDIIQHYSLISDFVKNSGLNFGILDVSNIPSPNFLRDPASWATAIQQGPAKPELVLFTYQLHRNNFNYSAFGLERFILNLQTGRSLLR